MKIHLDQGSLEGIVDKHVVEILSRWEVSRRLKRLGMYKRICAAIRKYQSDLKTIFLPILITDFSETISIKIRGSKMEKNEVDKLKEFLRMVKDSDIEYHKIELKELVEEVMRELHEGNMYEFTKAVLEIIEEAHGKIVDEIDDHIRCVILDYTKKSTLERSELGAAIYNFTDKKISDEVKELFKNGVNSVPRFRLSSYDVKKRVEEALLNYLRQFRSKYSWRYINEEDVLNWLEGAMKLEGISENLEFYQRVKEGYKGLMEEIKLLYGTGEGKGMTEDELRKKLEVEGTIIVHCDKNLGMSMFSLETMRKADEKLMEQLGATAVEEGKKEVLEEVFAKIRSFEESLDDDQIEYLDFVYQDRDVSRCEIIFPFLRSTHKIQKMTAKEIEEKDLSSLKFRPVVDSKRWATRGYAELMMKMLRKAVAEILDLAGPIMGEMKVKNGWEFSSEVKEYEFQEKFGIMLSCDIQEAYSNVTAVMIKTSIEVVCKFLGYEEWRKDLMKKIIDLVLDNNYVETSTGIYLFKPVLPMGYKCSGECLDIVGVAGEITKLFNLGKIGADKFGLPVSELTNYPEDLVEIGVEKESSMARGVRKYKRYVDDTFGIVSGEQVEVISDGIMAIGFMFPAGLIINLDLNVWKAEFLDVFCWKSLTGDYVSTMMKRNSKVPFGHIKKKSDHPEKYKLKSLLGELLRNRRIASDEGIVEVIDICIVEDFISIGYTRRIVEEELQTCMEKIETNYSSEFVKKALDNERKIQFGGSVVYNGDYEYNRVLEGFIRMTKPENAPHIVSRPGNKLKSIAYSKRRYLKRQQEDTGKQLKKYYKK